MQIYFQVVIFVFILLPNSCSFSCNIVYNDIKKTTAPCNLQLAILLLEQAKILCKHWIWIHLIFNSGLRVWVFVCLLPSPLTPPLLNLVLSCGKMSVPFIEHLTVKTILSLFSIPPIGCSESFLFHSLLNCK